MQDDSPKISATRVPKIATGPHVLHRIVRLPGKSPPPFTPGHLDTIVLGGATNIRSSTHYGHSSSLPCVSRPWCCRWSFRRDPFIGVGKVLVRFLNGTVDGCLTDNFHWMLGGECGVVTGTPPPRTFTI